MLVSISFLSKPALINNVFCLRNLFPGLRTGEENPYRKFKQYLKIHQQGQTDYLTFCKHSAETGVEKWTVDLLEMTCTYYDKAGNIMLMEEIPA